MSIVEIGSYLMDWMGGTKEVCKLRRLHCIAFLGYK